MKILSTQMTRQADEATIAMQGISSVELMERAAGSAYKWIKDAFPHRDTLFHVYCGQGNNGGDGLAIARMLHKDSYKVLVTIVESAGTPTADFKVQLEELHQAGLEYNRTEMDIVTPTVIVDALFGIGFSRELDGTCRQVINTINSSNAFVISIDVPSGMFMENPTTLAVMADAVLTFQYPKLPFFMASNYKFIGRVIILDIGLDKEFLLTATSSVYYIDRHEVLKRYIPIGRYAHKGTQGHVLVVGGSYGKIGAVMLSAKAALKAGCGLVTAYIPECGYDALQAGFPEAMVLTDGESHITKIKFDIQPRAIAIGMGLGTQPETMQALHNFLLNNKVPLVIDADALNLIAENPDWLELLAAGAVLTPHPKELARLIGEWADDFDRLEKIRQFSKKYNVVVVAKDARTMTINHEDVYVNSTGNAALATGGSGDVLAGIIAGLIAQGYSPVDAAITGVYLHGLTADIAVPDTSAQAFTASTILEYLGKAFLTLDSKKREN